MNNEKILSQLMDCFEDKYWDKYDFDKLVQRATVSDDFILVKGSNFKALFDKEEGELVNFETQIGEEI